MKNLKKVLIAVVIILIIAMIAVAVYFVLNKENDEIKIFGKNKKGKKDDWMYKSESVYDNDMVMSSPTVQSNSINSAISKGDYFAPSSFEAAESFQSDATIGLSTGGAENANAFRNNIKNGYFPISTDITYNGIFSDYVFDTGNKVQNTKDLFYPSYSTAVSKDPISGEEEYYITVGMNSNIKASDFKRKKLNLVIVLDISGSMTSSLNSYYYDSNNKNNEEYKSKMEVANESITLLIDELNDDDRFGMVLFDDRAYLAKELNMIGDTDVQALKKHILEITPQGGTNFEAGYSEAQKLFENIEENDEYENRIMVITDAMPNTGNTSRNGLLSYIKENAKNNVYTTFIGVGVDFNTSLIETLVDCKGANYYSVNDTKHFKELLSEQFEYMVTPLVFDLELNVSSDYFEIEKIYGSDTANAQTGNILKVNTLFPAVTTSEGEVKGGVILLKLKKAGSDRKYNFDDEKSSIENKNLEIKVSYKDRNNNAQENTQQIVFENNKEHYDNTGIRKAIMLTRYANTLKNWILYERSHDEKYVINEDVGINLWCLGPTEIYNILGEHERQSVKLTVSDEYNRVFRELKQYMQNEIKEIQDKDLNQEIDILELLIKN